MKLLLLITFALLTSMGYSQTQDSIALSFLQKIRTATNDSVKIDLELKLADRTHFFDVDTSRTIVYNVLETIEQRKNQSYYYKKQKARALNYLGVFAMKQDKTDETLSHCLKALEICEVIQDSIGTGLALHNLGMFYRIQEDYTKSIYYFKKGIAIKELLHDVDGLAVSYQMLANTFFNNKQNDSALIYTKKAKALMTSKRRVANVNAAIAGIHYNNGTLDKAIGIYKENIANFKAANDQSELSLSHLNTASVYIALNNYDEAAVHLDSAIFSAKKQKYIELLVVLYRQRSNLNSKQKKYAEALEDYKIYKAYFDSINDTKKTKRITALKLNYKFEKEKLADQLVLESETSKRELYFLLFILTMCSGAIILLLYRKNAKNRLRLSKSKLEREQLEKLKTELALMTGEKELTRAVVENSLRQEVLHKTLESVKDIIGLENRQKRNNALQTLWATLLSEKTNKTTSESFKTTYLDEVCMDFKVILNTKFQKLNEKEKEILCFMTLGLKATQISELQKTTTSAIKSTRYRIRKKLNLDSKADIITFIKSKSDVNTEAELYVLK